MDSFASFREVVELSPNGVVVTKLVGAECLYVNNAWVAITGLSLEQSLGDKWVSVISDDNKKLFFDEINASTRDNRLGIIIVKLVNGSSIRFNIIHTTDYLYFYCSKI